MTSLFVRRVFSLFTLVAGLVGTADAQVGALGVSPTNILFDGRARSVEVTLINRGTEKATYRISFQHLRQNENGELLVVENADDLGADERPADALLRYSPRQVTVEPGKPQSVRVMLRKPAGLAAGEYRSHLLFQQLPPPDLGESIEPDTKSDQVAVKLVPLFGVSIPVMVREGELNATSRLDESRLIAADAAAGAPAMIETRIHREGNASVRGDLEARLIPASGAAAIELGVIRGISVLYPNTARVARVPLEIPDGVKLASGKLQLVYRRSGEGEQRPVLATTELSLP